MPWEHYCAPVQHCDNSIVYLGLVFQVGWKNGPIQPDSKQLFHQAQPSSTGSSRGDTVCDDRKS